MTFRISRAAQSDMLDIGRYTEASWGREQRNLYLKRMDASFHKLASQPNLGRSCYHVSPGYRKYPEGKHVIYYRIAEDTILEIIRILHESMDVSTHFDTMTH